MALKTVNVITGLAVIEVVLFLAFATIQFIWFGQDSALFLLNMAATASVACVVFAFAAAVIRL